MIGSIVAIQMGYSVVHWYGTQQFLRKDVFRANQVGESRLLSQQIVFSARQMEVQCTFNNPAYLVPNKMVESISVSAEKFATTLNLAKEDKTLFNNYTYTAWREPRYALKQRESYNNPVVKETDALGLFALFQSMARLTPSAVKNANCTKVRKEISDPTSFQKNTLKHDASWMFILDNGVREVVGALGNVLDVVLESVHRGLLQEQKYFLGISLAAILLPLCIIVANVTLDYAPLAKERVAILSIFFNLPKDTIAEMLNSVRSSLHQLNINISNQETSTISVGTASKASFGGSKTSSMGSTNLGSSTSSIDSAEDAVNPRRAKTSIPIWRRVLLVFLFTTIVEFALLIASTTMMYEASTRVFDSSIEIYNAGSRQVHTFRVLVLAQELIRRDAIVWPELEELRREYELSIHTAFEANKDLKYGNEEKMLYGSIHKDPVQDHLMYVRNCSLVYNSCASLDEMYSYYLDQAYALLYLTDDQLVLDHPIYAKMLEMQHGYLAKQLASSIDIFRVQVQQFLKGKVQLQDLLFGISFPVAFVVAFLIYKMMKGLRFHIDSTRHILGTIPVEHMSRSEALRKYMKKGIIPNEKKWKKKREKQNSLVNKTIQALKGIRVSAGLLEKLKRFSKKSGDTLTPEDDLSHRTTSIPVLGPGFSHQEIPEESNELPVVDEAPLSPPIGGTNDVPIQVDEPPHQDINPANAAPKQSVPVKPTRILRGDSFSHPSSGRSTPIESLVQLRSRSSFSSSPVLKNVGFERASITPIPDELAKKLRYSERSLSESSSSCSSSSSSDENDNHSDK
jgi:hypothetical protein